MKDFFIGFGEEYKKMVPLYYKIIISLKSMIDLKVDKINQVNVECQNMVKKVFSTETILPEDIHKVLCCFYKKNNFFNS